MTDATLITSAFAKINVALEVLGRRADGYHEVRTLMQTVSLADELRAVASDRPGLSIGGAEAAGVPAGEANLAMQALAEYGQVMPPAREHQPIRLLLKKRIPAAAGLGGGSSDAAGVLRLVDAMKQPPIGPRRLETIAVALGSDVAFFVRGGTQMASARGENLEVLPDSQPVWFALLCPPFSLTSKTARLYGSLRDSDFSDGSHTERLAVLLRSGGTIAAGEYFNTFDPVALAAFPGLNEFRQALVTECGNALLCGTGPSLFAQANDEGHALHAVRRLQEMGMRAFAVRTVSAIESIVVTPVNDTPAIDILQ
jgi:4-diphosphocytidyl-2-C-methyl-D-erythritol kinase